MYVDPFLPIALLAAASTSAASPMLGYRRSFSSVASVSQSSWDALNQSVSGRLQNGEPMMAPCFNNVNGHMQSPDSGVCDYVQKNKTWGPSISQFFGGYLNANWGACQATGQGCSLNYFLTPDLISPVTKICYQGSVPSKYIDVRNVSDIQNGVRFANQNNLRLVIKNTGHDYKGRSSAPDSFALWTHNLQDLKFEKDFVPEGASSPIGDVITMGAGVQFEKLYTFAHQNNVRVTGGTSTTVGAAGGWIAGGGHSILSNELGLGADNAQQLKVVLANGSYVTANRYQNQDLFFALRGGGGGTFGVVTEFSITAHPEKQMEFASFTLFSLNSQNINKLLTILVDNADKWASEGWGGFLLPSMATNMYTKLSFATTQLSHDQAVESMKPLTDFVNNVLGLSIGSSNITTCATFWDTFQQLTGLDNSNNMGLAMSSRLVPRKYFQDNNTKSELTSILSNIATASSNTSTYPVAPLFICVTAPTLYSQNLPASDKPGGPGDSSIAPAWRNSLWHVIHTQPFDPTLSDPSAIAKIFQETHDAMNPLRDLTPDGGAYQNEADTFEPNPIDSFWGQDNYKRLQAIKQQVDPTNLFTVHQGVNWDPNDGRYSCYPNVSSS